MAVKNIERPPMDTVSALDALFPEEPEIPENFRLSAELERSVFGGCYHYPAPHRRQYHTSRLGNGDNLLFKIDFRLHMSAIL